MSKIEDVINKAKAEIESEMESTYPDSGKDGGKKLRGALTVIISDCFGGDHEKAVKYAAAVEFIHHGSIVHDDIIDEHEERRGKPSKAITDGIKKALLIGDMYFTKAIKIGAEGGSEEAMAVAQAMETVLGGAIKEFSMSDVLDSLVSGKFEDDIYYRIISAKTAALFGCAAQFGAMTFTKDQKVLDDFFSCGMLIGQAYQIADDMVDLLKMADGDIDINPTTVIPVIPAIVKYNKNVIKALPFKVMMGRADIISLATEGIANIDISDKMITDINENLLEAMKIVSRYDFPGECFIEKYSNHAINKMLEEAGEKI